jgi:hypothetical protein
MIDGKKVVDYLFGHNKSIIQGHITLDDFEKHPATAFLKFTIDAKDAIEQCKIHFPKQANGHPTLENLVCIQNIINSTLATIMSCFETYEKHLFAGIFETTAYFESFNTSNFIKQLSEHSEISISIEQLLGYRLNAAPTGMLIANCLSSWHNPTKVNSYFKSFGLQTNMFSNEDVEDLDVLWQLRHSIVHTGACVSHSDSQKNKQLSSLGGKVIVFSNKFIYELTKRFHSLIYNATNRVCNAITQRLPANLPTTTKKDILELFEVRSVNSSWLV